MKKIILGNEDSEPTTYPVPASLIRSAKRVAASASQLLEKGAQTKTILFSPDHAPLLRRGAEWLSILGAPGNATLMTGSTYLIGAHAVTCLATIDPNLIEGKRNNFFQLLGFFGNAAPCFLLFRPLPSWRKLKNQRQASNRIRDLYQKLHDEPDTGFWELKVNDAIGLLRVLRHQTDPQVIQLEDDLQRVTAVHRHALARLLRPAKSD